MITLIEAKWPAPDSVRAFVSCRSGGVSSAPYHSLNLALHVGDETLSVVENRAVYKQMIGNDVEIHWLNQVHGVKVAQAEKVNMAAEADALVSRQKNTALAILTADCLPVLFCDIRGTAVAAAHAGWRGLARGILENTFAAMDCKSEQVMAWMGPAISVNRFEVGAEVRSTFLDAISLARHPNTEKCFRALVDKPGYFMADLYGLARERLNGLGIKQIFGGDFCTWDQPDLFYSYRRDGITGRMASIIYRV